MISIFVMMVVAAQPEIDCDNAMTQMDMNVCAGQEYQEADDILNREWDLMVDHMRRHDVRNPAPEGEPEHFETLLQAQRAWITYRDMHCRSARLEYRGGSIAPLIHATCMTELTERRTAELQDLRSTQ